MSENTFGNLPEGIVVPQGGLVQPEVGAPLMRVGPRGLGPLGAPTGNMYAPDPGAYGANCCQGYDKHFGRAVAYIELGKSKTFTPSLKIYWFMRITVNSAITIRENTDPDSPTVQYQPTRRTPISLDLESMVPQDGAGDFTNDLRQGAKIEAIRFAPGIPGVEESRLIDSEPGPGVANWFLGSGPFFIESTNIEATRDDWTTVRISIRGSGYNACDVVGTPLQIRSVSEANYTGLVVDVDTQGAAALDDNIQGSASP